MKCPPLIEAQRWISLKVSRLERHWKVHHHHHHHQHGNNVFGLSLFCCFFFAYVCVCVCALHVKYIGRILWIFINCWENEAGSSFSINQVQIFSSLFISLQSETTKEHVAYVCVCVFCIWYVYVPCILHVNDMQMWKVKIEVIFFVVVAAQLFLSLFRFCVCVCSFAHQLLTLSSFVCLYAHKKCRRRKKRIEREKKSSQI